MDVAYANSLIELSKKLKELVNTNIQKINDHLKKAVNQLHSEFKKKSKLYLESQALTEKYYKAYVTHFD